MFSKVLKNICWKKNKNINEVRLIKNVFLSFNGFVFVVC